VSKIATGEAKPNGELEVPSLLVQPFLDPLSIKKIPGIGDKTFRLLRSMGISNIQTLSHIPRDMMEKVLGQNGLLLWNKANGIDNSSVQAYWEQKSISTERTFDKDSTDVDGMHSLLVHMTEKLAYELRQQRKLTSCITVKIRYSNFDTHTLQKRIPYTSFDHQLIPLAQELFNRLYQRRMLIRLLGVRFTHLVQGTQQLNMFEDTPEMTNLYIAMDRLRNRYGRKAIQRAAGLVKVKESDETTTEAPNSTTSLRSGGQSKQQIPKERLAKWWGGH
jgi:DNA polymerase-4